MTRTKYLLPLILGAAAAPSLAATDAETQPAASPTTEAQNAGAPAPAPSRRFKGAPRFESESGWSLKPRGRVQYDVGHVSAPDGIVDPGLGTSDEFRRARIGVEGDIPGGFGYVFEVDLAGGEVEIVDANLSYEASDALGFTLGQHNPFQSLEELTSSRFTSFMERAAFTDAFGFNRKLGFSANWSSGDLIAQAGLFTDNIHDLDESAESFSLDGRLVFSPKLGDTQLHLGGSAHWRDRGDVTAGTLRYGQRPQLHSTDIRFVRTPALAVDRETSYGVEAAMIRGPFHAAGEVHWLDARTRTGAEPTFFGGYAELGYFLTGETRGYKGGRFDRTKVRRSIEEGGFGAVQVNLRYDHLDLNSGTVRGGRQQALQASLIWIPTDHVRFMVNYSRLSLDEAVIAAPGGDRNYRVDVIGARAQIDF